MFRATGRAALRTRIRTSIGAWIGASLIAAASASLLAAQGVSVSAKISADPRSVNGKAVSVTDLSNVVMWLSPLQPHATSLPPPQAGPYRLTQKDKQFTPHLLVVPTGASVQFPNLDPFFHNVFSLFNGKRFDLGLYESGSSRSVRFDREGVSYIFCNIHPDMGAVVLALSTPYYATSDASGQIVIHNVVPGSYELNFWSESVPARSLTALKREIRVAADDMQLGAVTLPLSGSMAQNHKNKYGEDYMPDPAKPY
jgi:plastocyanin